MTSKQRTVIILMLILGGIFFTADSLYAQNTNASGDRNVRNGAQYMRELQQLDQMHFVNDFIAKKKMIDDIILKQKFYTQMLDTLSGQRQGLEEVIRREKRELIMQRLAEIQKTLDSLESGQ